jgi:transcriptional regulator with XRE-family HTH domain
VNDQTATFARWDRLIAEQRQQKGLTQRQLGDRIGRDVITVSRAERGLAGLDTYLAAGTELDINLFADEATA